MTSKRILLPAVVTEIHDRNITYPSCVTCYSKLLIDPISGRYHCIKCGKNFDKSKLQWRYRLVISISDRTCVGKIVVFGTCLDGFFGKTASDFTRSMVDLEKTGYPAQSMLSEALHHTFLGKYFYFGFKVVGVCAYDKSTSLKDVLNLDTSLVPSQLDCTSNFDNCHTLAHQMLACSDENFSTVTHFMRILVKNLRTRSNSKENTEEKSCANQDQSNHSTAGENGCNETSSSKTLSELSCFELGLNSVCFSFENGDCSTGSACKLEHSKAFIDRSSSSECVQSNFVKGSSSIQSKETSMNSDHSELHAYTTFANDFYDCRNSYSEHCESGSHYNEYTSMFNTFSDLNIPQDEASSCSNHHVSQKFLFKSPNGSLCSNTSKKIDKELFRREILSSINQTDGQLPFHSEKSLINQITINSTRNGCNLTTVSSKAELEWNHTLGNVSEVDFPETRTDIDFIPLPSTSILKNQLAEQVAMPDSEDLNAFFDSDFDGIVFAQDDDTLDAPNDIESKKSDDALNDSNKNKRDILNDVHNTSNLVREDTGEKIACNKNCEFSLNKELVRESSEGKAASRSNNKSDHHLAKVTNENDCDKNITKSEIKSPETNLEVVSGINEISNERDERNDTNSDELISDVNVISFKQNEVSTELEKSDISQTAIKVQGDLASHDIGSDAKNLSPVNKVKADKSSVHSFTNKESEAMTSTKDGDNKKDNDLEQFFADISKYEIDIHYKVKHNKLSCSVDSDLEKLFADISKSGIEIHEEVDAVVKAVKGRIETSKLFDSDLEQFFADISKFEIDEHVHLAKQKEEIVAANHNNDNQCENDKLDNVEDDRMVSFVTDSHSNSSDIFSQGGALNLDCYKVADSEEENEVFENEPVCPNIRVNKTIQKDCIKQSCSRRDPGEKQKVNERTDMADHVSLNDSLVDQLCSEPESTNLNEFKSIGTEEILVENSFDASGDLFNSSPDSGSTSTDDNVVIVGDSLLDDELDDVYVLDDTPVDASTPGLDECKYFDDLDCVVFESDSEMDIDEQINDGRTVKFAHKLRRVSTCNVMDLKMKVAESPVLFLDKSIHLKSCLRVPKKFINVGSSPVFKQHGIKYCDKAKDMNKSKESFSAKKCLMLSEGASNLSKVSSNHSFTHDASVDLFGDSFHQSELGDSVLDVEIKMMPAENEAITLNILKNPPARCSNDKENCSRSKKNEINENLKLDERNLVSTCGSLGASNDSMTLKDELSNSVLEEMFSPDIFENSDFEQNGSSLNVGNRGVSLQCYNNMKQRNGAFKNNVKVVKNTKCASKLTDDQLQGKRSPLKCLVLNTPDCSVSLSNHRIQKHTSSVYDYKQSGSLNFQKLKHSDENQSNIDNPEDNQSTLDFMNSHSSFYSPDLFNDSILEPNDDKLVCDTSTDVLCKKLYF